MSEELVSTLIISLGKNILNTLDVPWLKVQHRSSMSEHILSVVLLDPVGKHVHASYGATTSPDVSVNNPLLVVGPIDFGIRLLHQVERQVVDGGILSIQDTC